MARTRSASLAPPPLADDQLLPGLEGLSPDPEPKPRRAATKRTPVKAAGNRGRMSSARRKDGTPMSTAEMRDKVSMELYMWLSMGVGLWDIRDPDCAAVMYEPAKVPTPGAAGGYVEVDRLAGIVERMVSMLARYPKALEYAAKSGIIGDVAVLGHLLMPIGKQLWRAHGPSGVGHRSLEEVQGGYAAEYPSYSARAAA